MFTTKASVKRHVEELFRKVKDETERKVRCYNIAKLFYQVGDYETAKQYASIYLEVKSESSAGRKLLGQIYESLGQKEAALEQYKQSLELDSRQDDLVLKVCELLVDVDTGLDLSRLKYWIDRANEKFPSHPIIFLLKEKILMAEKTNGSSDDLEMLILSELSVRSSDVNLRVKLIKYFMEKNRLKDAYQHAMEIENFSVHRNDIKWYEILTELLVKCKERQYTQWPFWLLYLSALERYAALSIIEYGNSNVKSIPDAIQAVFNFDQGLTEAKSHILSNTSAGDQIFNHMTGQLYYYLACLLLRKTKREQKSWAEVGRMCSLLFLSAVHSPLIDQTSTTRTSSSDLLTNSLVSVWIREASFRTSQSNHILQEYSKDNLKKMMDKVDEQLSRSWREQIFNKIFIVKHQEKMINTSYFVKLSKNPPLRLLSATELKQIDEVAKEVYPASLHHHVWLGLAKKHQLTKQSNDSEPFPNASASVFTGLQLSVPNLNQAAPDTLGILDIDAFLNAAIICSSSVIDEQQRSGFLSPDRLPILPADLTNSLCTTTQENWWSMAYKIYKEKVPSDLGSIRQELQRGLEVVRCIGNHGLHPVILVQLARVFQHRVKSLNDSNEGDLKFLEARCELYWSTAIPLLERMINNNSIRSISSKMFDYQGKEMNNLELTNALDEGRLFLAKKYIKDKQYETAIDALHLIKSPEASFLLGDVYKKLADELIEGFSNDNISHDLKSQYTIMLTKAKNSYYLTLDRLRNPGVDQNHPLNAELGLKIIDIESELKVNDDEMRKNMLNLTGNDEVSDNSYLSTVDGTEFIEQSFNKTYGNPLFMSAKSNVKPREFSTPRNQNVSSSRFQTEARPSPERLDAQMRQLMYVQDNTLQSILEQQKFIIDSNKQLQEALDEVKKALNDLKLESKSKASTSNQKTQKNEENQFYNFDLNRSDMDRCSLGPSGLASAVPPPPPPQMFNPRYPAYPPPLPYLPPVPFNDLSRIQSLYLPDAYGYQYPPRNDQNMMPKVPDMSLLTNSLLHQTQMFHNQVNEYLTNQQQPHETPFLGTRSLPNVDLSGNDLIARESIIPQPVPLQPQFPGVLPPTTSLSAPFQHPGTLPMAAATPQQASTPLQSATKVPAPKPVVFMPSVPMPTVSTTIKDAPVIKAPPVNVVITTSDTLPTNVPTVQPTLSVTIPPHHINSGSSGANPAHNYQISMPTQAMIPTTVNLPSFNNSVISTMAPTANNANVVSTGSHNGSIETVEVEHDPIPDFAPIIPLPDEIVVTTGEENEETLFCARAKLYRFVSNTKEWKERGVGNVKLLKNVQGKVRLLMRRDQVHKICANHLLTTEMKLSAMNDKAWIWVANDFADEEVKLEKLCIKFKLEEEAQSFKENFEKAQHSMSNLSKSKVDKAKPTVEKGNQQQKLTKGELKAGGNKTEKKAEPSLAEMFKPAAGSWECTSCYVRNNGSVTKCTACSTPAPGSQSSNQATNQLFGQASAKTTGQTPLSQLFKPEEGSWECSSCYVRNKKANSYCVTCETPKDPSQGPKPKATTTSTPFTLQTTSTATKPTFSFGFPPSQPAVSTNQSLFKGSKDTPSTLTPPSTFSFVNTQNNKDSSVGFSFSSAKPATETSSTTFGKSTFGETKEYPFNAPTKLGSIGSTTPGSNFQFGQPGKSFNFQFENKSPAKSPTPVADVSEDEVPESEDIYFAPVVPLPDKIDVKTGEEDEEMIYTHRAKLFRFDSTTKEWKERGVGDIKLLQHKKTKKLRLVMRREQTLKLCLNHFVNNQLEITEKDEKTWLWNAADYSEGEIEYIQFACRFKNKEIANTFKKTIDSTVASLPAESTATDEEKPASKPEEKRSDSVPELQVVYEVQVTPEEKDAALKLQLPENFYAYKQKEDCAGCLGCKEPEMPLYDDTPKDKKVEDVAKSSEATASVQISPPKFSLPKSTSTITSATSTVTSGSSDSPKSSFVMAAPQFKYGSPPVFKATADKTDELAQKQSEATKNLFANLNMCTSTASKPTLDFSKAISSANKPTTTSTTTSNIFGNNNSSSMFGGIPSIFGGKTSTVTSSTPTATATATSTLTNNTFGFSFALAKPKEEQTTYVFGQKPTGSVFGGSSTAVSSANSLPSFEKLTSNSSGNKIFGETSIFSGKSFEGATPTFGATAVSKTETPPAKAEEPSFLKNDNILDFSTLAKGSEAVGFRTAENFTFAGTGAPVFGKKPPSTTETSAPATNDTASTVSTPKKAEENEEEAGADDNAEYDPHYEPIIPLPDAVEVKTGEEDEEKLFCQRAKLFRFEADTKEWKERGTGEMKLLYHPVNSTYRLVLRREQVFKVVCNFLITPEIDLQPLLTSDKAWMWAGMNFIEDKMEMEKLAVRFKNADFAKEFKDAVEKAKKEVVSKQQLKQLSQSKSEDKDTNEDEEEPDEYQVEEADDEVEDEDDHSVIFEKHAVLSYFDEPEGFQSFGDGQLKIVYDSEFYGARILFFLPTDEIISSSLISMESEIQIDGRECTWTTIDDFTFENSVRRMFRAQFETELDAQEMVSSFQEGLDFAKHAEISENVLYDQEDQDES